MPDLTAFLDARTDARPLVAILQPADPFLDVTGEDMRRRVFMTQMADGAPLCLRPEFTIPICLMNLPAGRYAYDGTVFRQERGGANEFRQAGLEDLGHDPTPARDAAALADMLGALALAGADDVRVTLGDHALFDRVVENLGLPKTIAARLSRAFGEPAQVDAIIDRLTAAPDPVAAPADRAATLALDGDLPALTDHVADMMRQAALPATGGRSASAIATRAIERAQVAGFRLDSTRAQALRDFLAIEAPLAETADRLHAYGAQSGVEFGNALKTFAIRADAIGVAPVTYRASFGRRLEYYSGVVFEAHRSGVAEAVAGGGRYDRLCTLLGAKAPVPAVGFSISLDRLGLEGRA